VFVVSCEYFLSVAEVPLLF